MIRLLLTKYKSEVLTVVVTIASLVMIAGGLVHVVIEVHSVDQRIESSLKENRERGKRLESVIADNRGLLIENQVLLDQIIVRLGGKP